MDLRYRLTAMEDHLTDLHGSRTTERKTENNKIGLLTGSYIVVTTTKHQHKIQIL